MSSKKSAVKATRLSETVCCRLTGPGRSAVAVVGIAGPAAAEALAICFAPARPRSLSTGQVRFGDWHGGPQQPPVVERGIATEAVVVTPLDDDSFEIHCHGGPAAVSRIADDLARQGIQRIEPEKWALRRGKPLLIVEAEQVLANCLTERTAAVAADQVRGAMLNWAEQQRQRLQRCPDHATHAATQSACRELLRHAPLGVRLAKPFRVVLCGPPNVGKSTLINAILGYQRSITFAQAGTTRDLLHAETVLAGLPIRLTDTAGMRDSSEPIEQAGVQRARFAIDDADLLVWVSAPNIDGELPPTNATNIPVLEVFNHVDRVDDRSVVGARLATSALRGDGLPELIEAIVTRLTGDFPAAGTAVPINERQAGCLGAMIHAEQPDQLIARLTELVGQDARLAFSSVLPASRG